MEESQKRTLLKVAKDTVEAVIIKKSPPEPHADDPILNAPLGCFVTLKNHGNLRGCIGRFISEEPLIQLIAEMARESATGDPRFVAQPITPDELPDLDIEISVLSPLERTHDPLSLRLGIDGIYIKKAAQAGCFLPQVATETNWTKEQFLSYCCAHKAGLAPDAWKHQDTEVYLFTAEVFGAPWEKI